MFGSTSQLPAPESGLKSGRVKFFDGEKGFGFITQDDGGPELRVYKNTVKGGGLLEGDSVQYKERGRHAVNVHGGTGGDFWGLDVEHQVRRLHKCSQPLHEALDESAPERVVSALIDRYPGAVRQKDHCARLPLHHALQDRAKPGTVMEILKRYPDAASMKDCSDMLPLHHALCESASQEVVMALLEHFAEGASVVDPEGMLPLHMALENAASEKVVLAVLEQYSDAATERDVEDRLPLHMAFLFDASEAVVLQMLAKYPAAARKKMKIKKRKVLPINLALAKGASGMIVFALLQQGFVRELPEPAVCNIAACLVGPRTFWDVSALEDSEHTMPVDDSSHLHSQSDVVQEIVHHEPAAQRDEELLQQQANHAWADAVENRIHAPPQVMAARFAGEDAVTDESPDAATDEAPPEDVSILRYKHGDSRRFREELLHGSELRACREAMSVQGLSCVHSSGALIFVQPRQYTDVVGALSSLSNGPYSYHIIVAESIEYLIEIVLGAFSYRARPRNREAQQLVRISAPDAGNSSASDSDESSAAADAEAATVHTSGGESDGPVQVLVTQRTFLCIAPIRREANSVAQSTTEAYTEHASISHYGHFRGHNPRRLVQS